MRRPAAWWLPAILAMVALACSLPGGGALPQSSQAETQDPSRPTSAETGSQSQDQTGGEDASEAEAIPVPLNEGLASLNSYRMEIISESTGPTPGERSTSTYLVEYDQDLDASHTVNETTTYDADMPEGFREVEEQYLIGNETCTLSEFETEFESISPLQREITDLMATIIDIKPPIENPERLGEELINGVETWHYGFRLTSLGSSGVEVAQSQGEYWMAKDGRYLVLYNLVIELRDAPEDDPDAQTVLSTVRIELTNINQPVAIEFPDECLAAREFSEDF